MPNEPYIVTGKVYQNGGSTPSTSTTITLSQDSTGQVLTTTTNSSGDYAFDLANFSSYSDEEYFTIIVTGSTTTSQDLRFKFIARSTGQISQIDIEYETA